MEDTTQNGTQATTQAATTENPTTSTPAETKAQSATEQVVEQAKEKVGEKEKEAKKGFKEKFSGIFGQGKKQFVRLMPSEQITVFVGLLLVILSIFDSYLTRAVIAIIGLVMIMVAFAGVKLNDIGGKKAKKKEADKAEATAKEEAKPATPAAA